MAQRDRRIEFHVHSFFSDGDLLPSEILRRAQALGFEALAITDHVDASNLEEVITSLLHLSQKQRGDFQILFIPGVELTHVAPGSISKLARRAKEIGAGLVLVHGETIVEPVVTGTNRAAVECPDVDILAHPGFITPEEAEIAAENGVYLELSSRKGHCLTNGHLARVALSAGAKLLVNSDAHSPHDLIGQEMARLVAKGAGLSEEEVEKATVTNPRALVQRAIGQS